MENNKEFELDFGDVKNQFRIQMEISLALNQRKIYLNEDVTENSIFKIMYLLNKIVDTDKKEETKEPIEICVNTNGGTVHDMFTLVSYIEQLKENGYKIITTNIGRAFSAGFVISICGTERRAYRYARYMFHGVAGGAFGKLPDMITDVEESKILEDMMLGVVNKYTDISQPVLENYVKCKVDKYYSADELKELKGVDIIL